MDSLRATNLSSILTQQNSNDGSKRNVLSPQQQLDKDNVSKLVKSFGDLSKHEKILFLINIREFTRDNNSGGVENKATVICNGTSSSSSATNNEDNSTSSSTVTIATPSTTPQSLRLSRTSNWLQKTFIQDSQVALPKEEVYSLYKHEFTQKQNEKPISTADFGKLMRQVFPDVKARRLGQRGQSKYCYANIRKRSEVEKPALPNPLPQNELVSWAKNKYNIDFGEVSQVVSFLKCEGNANNSGGSSRKRRASCGGNLLKNNKGKSSARSASVSTVLELHASSSIEKDDPLMLLHDNESLEIGSYFENSLNNSTGTSSNWPQLRSLLTTSSDDNSISNDDTFINFNSISSSALLSSTSSKKKRHSSSVQFEFIKPECHGMLHRSQSVPVTEMSFIRGNPAILIDDQMQTSSSSNSQHLFDDLGNGGGGGSNGGVVDLNNPLFSSGMILHVNKDEDGVGGGTSAFDVVGVDGSGSGGVDIIGGNGVLNGSVVDVVVGNGGSGGSNGVGGGSGGGGGVVGNDVFFDSVFDLMMSDCQN